MFRRQAQVRAEISADGGLTSLRILASTDEPVDMGGWREVLKHGAADIDLGSATALLLNHDPNRIVGALRACKPDGKRMDCEADLDDSAQLDTGMSVKRAVAIGALRGASIGYTYERKDCTYDESARTVTVSKWRLLELSLTPIPADGAAGIQRSIPFDIHKETPMADPIVPAPVDPAPAILAEQREVAELARGLGLDAAEYVGKSKADAQKAMLVAAGERLKKQHKEPEGTVTVARDEADKMVDAAVDAYTARVCGGKPAQGNPFAGRSLKGIAARWASQVCRIRTDEWSKEDWGNFVIGRSHLVHGARDAANVISSNFANFVTANIVTKIVAKGHEMAQATTVWRRIADVQSVPDFKQFRIGGLGMGNLIETKENEAYPEIVKAEGYYNDQLAKWGATVSLTREAAANDDTGEFDRGLRQAGAIAEKSIDKRVIQKLLRGSATTDASTWTSNTTSGTTIVYTTGDTIAAARANISKGNIAMQTKVGLDGNPIGNLARFLVCGPTNSIYARGLLAPAGGAVVGTGDLEVVSTPWLEASTLTGYSTTTYYLLADPMAATGLLVSFENGVQSIAVTPYDAGAVDAVKFKLSLAFEASLYSFANAAGTTIIPAAQQCTT